MVAFSVRAFFILLMLLSSHAYAAVIATVDRNSISENETLLLSIEITGDDDGEPETAPLSNDFEVLSRNHSSSYSYMNGTSSSKSVWEISLRPRRSGNLVIPAIRVDSAFTSPISIKVREIADRSSAAGKPVGNIWISMEVEPKQLLVQQQAILKLRIYQGIALNQAQMGEPEVPHALIERLGNDKTYQSVENGRTWHVTERRYALFPQQSGSLEIPAVQLDGSVLVAGNRSYFQSTKRIRARSNSLSIEVLTIPKQWGSDEWLPAKDIQLIENWPDTPLEFKVGEAITRSVTVQGSGIISSQLPILSSALPDHLKVYPDQPTLNDVRGFEGLRSQRQEKFAIMATRPGSYTLPEITLPWWNTASGMIEVARIPARTFTVVAAVGNSTASVPQAESLTVAPSTEITSKDGEEQVSLWWKWLAIVSSLGWLLVIVLLWRLRASITGKEKHSGEDAIHLKAAKKEIEKCCRQNQAKACEQALLQYARARWPELQLNSLQALTRNCAEPLRAELLKLERFIYASTGEEWSGEVLLKAFHQEGFIVSQRQHSTPASALPALYPE